MITTCDEGLEEEAFHAQGSIMVPLSVANAAELFETPLYKEPGASSTVFLGENSSQQLKLHANPNGGCVRFVRATILEDTLNKPWNEQLDLMNKIPKTDCAELIDLIFLCGLQRLESGTFSLTQDPEKQCYARVPESVHATLDTEINGIEYRRRYKSQMVIGQNGDQLNIVNDLLFGDAYAPDGIGLIPRMNLSKIKSA